VGDTLTYTITATNIGTANLTNVTVSDPKITPSSNSCALLAPTETCVLVGTYVVTAADVTAGQIDNLATGDTDQTDPVTDPETVPVPTPSLGIAPKVPDSCTVSSGTVECEKVALTSTATFTITVSNTGTANLTNVTVSDPLAPGCDNNIGFIGAGNSVSYDCNSAAVSDDFVNVATADSTQTGPTSDDSFVDALPVISVTKTADPANLPAPGGEVTFTIVVTNNSGASDTVMITSLTDDVYGDLSILDDAKLQLTTVVCDPMSIAPGASATCSFTANVTIPEGDFTFSETDVVTVVATDEEGNNASDNDDATVIVTPPIAVTDSQLCIYDVDGDASNGRQWRNLFTQDTQNWPNFKLNATNRGQTFYNLSAAGDPGDTVELTLSFPWPFVTQGARALHAWDTVGLYENAAGETCFCPGEVVDGECIEEEALVACDFEITLDDYLFDVINPPGDRSGYTQLGDGSWSADQKAFNVADEVLTSCTVTIPESGFLYFNQHLDLGLKGPHVDIEALGGGTGDGVDRYQQHGDDDAVDPATIADPDPSVLIPELANHDFCVDVALNTVATDQGGCDGMQNDNEFKKNAGVAGRVTIGSATDGDSVTGATVELTLNGQPIGTCDGKVPTKKDQDIESDCPPGTDFSDSDGWWQVIHKHKGKPTDYLIEVTLPQTEIDAACSPDPAVWTDMTGGVFTRFEQLKGNEFSEVNIELTCSP
jgi:uncharacterized repeat protein (TIGR01451 family)